MRRLVSAALNISAAATLLAGCNGSQPPISVPRVKPEVPAATAARGTPWALPQKQKIQHIVIVIQDGRSYNNLFNGYPGTVSYGYDSKGRRVELQPVSLGTKWKIDPNFYVACNGTGSIPGTDCRMNGFDLEKWTCAAPGEPRCPIKYPPYAYVPHTEIRPYLDIASQYVLADEMYASNFDGGSFESLQYIVEAQDHDTIGLPTGVPGCGGGPYDWIETIGSGRKHGRLIHPCFDNKTIGDELDAAGLTWAYYAVNSHDVTCRSDHGSGAYWAIKHICFGPDWNEDIISPPAQFVTDVKHGNLRNVTWVTPTYKDSDQAGSGWNGGPSWVASLVNAVGKSKYWKSTAIFIFWDGFGGWYDPEPPRYVSEDGLGIRIPLLVISPYAKRGYVSHVHYEHTSILRFVEDQYGLAQLGQGDERATSPERDCFDFNQPPRKFVPIKAPM